MHTSRSCKNLLLLVPFLSAACASSPPVDLAADVDRDGVVDLRKDAAGEEAWTARRGALFLNNNDDDGGRGAPDHTDAVVNGPADLEDLTLVVLRCNVGIAPDARLEITVDAASRERVRLFLPTAGGGWEAPDLARPVPIAPARVAGGDLEMRIEALTYADRTWNGEVVLTATLIPVGSEPVSDAVRLRVAPFILLSNLQTGTELYVREATGRNELFISQLADIASRAGFTLTVIPEAATEQRGGIWCQDAMEIGFSQVSGRSMSVVLRANRDRPLDEVPRQLLLGTDYGWFTCGVFRPEIVERDRGNRWLDWYGNLEVAPPVPGYPLGRVYYGSNGEEALNPEIVAMLDAQGVQGPAVKLDTGWLVIKHVDEMVCFVPTGEGRHPHKVLVPDPEAMIALLDRWVAEGHGEAPILQPFQREDEAPMTVASLQADTDLRDHNLALSQDRIRPNRETLKNEFGLEEDDFIGIPAYFTPRGGSLFPNLVNSVVINGHFLTSDPHGPVAGGADLLQQQVRELLSELPLEVHFLDDRIYHRGGGNVHCATNMRRTPFARPWWTYLGDR
jgi:protein-arginine deiminase